VKYKYRDGTEVYFTVDGNEVTEGQLPSVIKKTPRPDVTLEEYVDYRAASMGNWPSQYGFGFTVLERTPPLVTRSKSQSPDDAESKS
jgi:hypothetical protein